MTVDVTFAASGRFWKGNLHTHSTPPLERRARARPRALSRAQLRFSRADDHFLLAFGFPIVDRRGFRTNRFTTILGGRVHAPCS